MPEHEPYTFPPGLQISDGRGGSVDPLGGLQAGKPLVLPTAVLKTLDVTPVELVAAVPGKWIVPQSITTISPAPTEDFTSLAPVFQIGYPDPDGTINISSNAYDLIATVASGMILWNWRQSDWSGPFIDQRGKPITLGLAGPIGPAGNGLLIVTVFYLLVGGG